LNQWVAKGVASEPDDSDEHNQYKDGISRKTQMLLRNIYNPIVDDAHFSQSSINFSRCNIMTPWLHFSKYISHLNEAKVKYFIIQNSNLSVGHE
jgi:hypothetical protein